MPRWSIVPHALSIALLAGLVSNLEGADKLPIAVLNMDRIYKTHKPLLDQLAPIKADAEKAEQSRQQRAIELETIGTQARKEQPGSAEFLRLQQQFLKLQGELQKYVTEEIQALQKREAAVHAQFQRDLDAEVAKYAKANGIQLVLRQQDSSFADNQPIQELNKSVNRLIIYEDGLDITDAILKALTESAGKPDAVRTR
jgi:Skp family chaperone for outer membrane proteins